ncbi:MAG TPA: hypothetical protein P5270_01560 [Victivallales bacterium]|nr:hypothetical protein [Victivallales bacterium]HPO90910.1 hypothetical protein [Victivallales bacterium]HRR28025.1 hypothetical protein [Victivallales bacterium]HRU01932.1 hypothetical protein [Victivallales bacterium]
MRKNKTVAKIAEIFFASGIPVLAVANFAKSRQNFYSSLPLLFFIIFIGGWHVKTFNDNCEEGNVLISSGVVFPLFLLPFVFAYNFISGFFLLITIINWDFYSIFGKKKFFLSMFHNFLGGFLHYYIGISALGVTAELFKPEAFFFAFAMLGGSMHHDAYHCDEDLKKNIHTGAVKFGKDLWWSLAVFPMMFSIFFLPYCDKEFAFLFSLLALLPYFTGYLIIISSAIHPSKLVFFRLVCRMLFGFAALIYIVLKL